METVHKLHTTLANFANHSGPSRTNPTHLVSKPKKKKKKKRNEKKIKHPSQQVKEKHHVNYNKNKMNR